MPIKKAKNLAKKYRRKSFKKKGITIFKAMRPRYLKEIFPDRMIINMTTTMSGVVASGSQTNSSLVFCVWGNNVYKPFNTVGSISNATIGTYVSKGARDSGQANIVDYLPNGYSQMTSIYQAYQVKNAILKVTATPTVSGDAFTLGIAPISYNNAIAIGVNGSVGSEVPYCAALTAMQYSKSKFCTGNNYIKGNTVSCSMNTGQINGYTTSQYKNAIINAMSVASVPDTTAGNQAEDLPWLFVTGLYAADNTEFSADIYLKVELIQTVTWSQPRQANQNG